MDAMRNGQPRYGRALVLFLLAYVVVTVIAEGFSMAVDALAHSDLDPNGAHTTSYVLSQRFYPLLNFFIWTAFGRLYFGDVRLDARERRREAVRVGALWLALALVVNFIGLALIERPFALAANAFDEGRFPWAFLIYLVVFSGPLCAAALKMRRAPAETATPPVAPARADGASKEQP
jgi:hypothetical protein